MTVAANGYYEDTQAAWQAGGTPPPWAGALRAPLPPLRAPLLAHQPRLDVEATLAGKHILLIGTTGFVGKVALAMLLVNYPNVGRVYCLIRPGAGSTAEERFYRKVATSEAFAPLRALHGDGFEAFLRSKIVAIPGDIGRPLCNLSAELIADITAQGGIDVIVNSAGLVSFMPTLEAGLRINAQGAQHVLDTARAFAARLVHVSTCFVAGRREGEVWEDEPVVGYYPRHEQLHDRDFDVAAEIADCQRVIEQTRDRANDRAHISLFRERAAKALLAQKRDPADEDALRLGVARERKRWQREELTRLGMERANHWGWTNTYTYTKSLGEQIILGDSSVAATVVRPAIVESALRFPFPGWNEGFNTTAPILYLMLKGHRRVPAADVALDCIPVDCVTAGIWLATAAVLDGSHAPVYQLGSSDVNRATAKRLTALTGVAVRNYYRQKRAAGDTALRTRLRTRVLGRPVSMTQFARSSAPQVRRGATWLAQQIARHSPGARAPQWATFADRARAELETVAQYTGQVIDLVELFRPFNYDHDVAFRCDNMRALWGRTTLADQDKLLWAPHLIDWEHYWLRVHFPGLQKWTFAQLDAEFGAPAASVYTYKHLGELFDTAVALHGHRTALRLTGDDGTPGLTLSYHECGQLAYRGAGVLHQEGAGPGAIVGLMSENRPEWALAFWAMTLAQATPLPVGAALPLAVVETYLRWFRPRVMVLSRRVAERLCAEAGVSVPAPQTPFTGNPLLHVWSPAHPALERYWEQRFGGEAPHIVAFDELLWSAEAGPVPRPALRGEDLALTIAGTDALDAGAARVSNARAHGPRHAVALSHKHVTTMVAKLAPHVALYAHDRVLPTAPLDEPQALVTGVLLPFTEGATVDYFAEPDAAAAAWGARLAAVGTSVAIADGAWWQAVTPTLIAGAGIVRPVAAQTFAAVQAANRAVRGAPLPALVDEALSKSVFFPVHYKLGLHLRQALVTSTVLDVTTRRSLASLGIPSFECYGTAEATAVLALRGPQDGAPTEAGLGHPVAGVELELYDVDGDGIGEIRARGPIVMAGYLNDAEASAMVLRAGWLHTGDLGQRTPTGMIRVVGEMTEQTQLADGRRVWFAELEQRFRQAPHGLAMVVAAAPGSAAGVVGLVGVPSTTTPALGNQAGSASRAAGRRSDGSAARASVRQLAAQWARDPANAALVDFALWEGALPTARPVVAAALAVLAAAVDAGRQARARFDGAVAADRHSAPPAAAVSGAWLHAVVARAAGRAGVGVTAATRIAELGDRGLIDNAVIAAMEAAAAPPPALVQVRALQTVGELQALADAAFAQLVPTRAPAPAPTATGAARVPGHRDAAKSLTLPAPVVRVGRRMLDAGMHTLFARYLTTDVQNAIAQLPLEGFIVAANHASHLDAGLVKHALGSAGPRLAALAAKDYFFADPLRRLYFENFTNLVPMERHGSLRDSLRISGEVLASGRILLIFPEGTRSETGCMTGFKPSLGYLALNNKCAILPMYLAGTKAAMPKGEWRPTRGAAVTAHVGPLLTYDVLAAHAQAQRKRSEQYQAVASYAEAVVRQLAPPECAWTLGPAGTTAQAEFDKRNA